MPFQSKAQSGWMFTNHPELARQWAAETPNLNQLKDRVQQRQLRPTTVAKVAAPVPVKRRPSVMSLGLRRK